MMNRALLALVFTFALTLSACGLSPVYGDHANTGRDATVAASLDNVYIALIADRTGQELRNLLIDRFYTSGRKTAANAQYRLEVDGIVESIYGLGIAKDATATRSQIKLTTGFILKGPNGSELLRRYITAVSSFNTLASDYTTLVTEENARDQTIQDLADQITTLLELYFTNPQAFAAAQAQEAADKETARQTRDLRPKDMIETTRTDAYHP